MKIGILLPLIWNVHDKWIFKWKKWIINPYTNIIPVLENFLTQTHTHTSWELLKPLAQRSPPLGACGTFPVPLPLHKHIIFPLLSLKLHRPFFCFCNLSPEPTQPSWLTSTTSVTFEINFLLYFETLALNSFFAKLKNRGPTSPVTTGVFRHRPVTWTWRATCHPCASICMHMTCFTHYHLYEPPKPSQDFIWDPWFTSYLLSPKHTSMFAFILPSMCNVTSQPP